MSFLRTIAAALLFLTLAPPVARADGLIIPFFGVNFGGDSGTELSDATDAERFNWGVSFAFMGAGVIGLEGDIGYSPDFFGETDSGGSSVLTMTGNLLIGIPFGGQTGFGIRPYGLVGAGIVRADGEAFEFDEHEELDVSENKAAWNFGGGVMMFFGTHVGIRGDVRYFRTFEALEILDVELGEELGDLDFTRGSIGLVFRF
jgi:opacity protein-like surface antigen